MCHLASAQYWDRPAGGNTGRLFLTFGGPVCAVWINSCPLDRALTYKNLIYLLNLQFHTKVYFFCMLNNVNNFTLNVKAQALYINRNILKTFLYFKC